MNKVAYLSVLLWITTAKPMNLLSDLFYSCKSDLNVGLSQKKLDVLLEIAVYFGDYSKAKALIGQGAQVCPSLLVMVFNKFGLGEYTRLRIIQLLVSSGIRFDARDSAGNTPLHLAITHGYYEIVQYLLENGADVYTCNNQGKSPLCLALQPWRAECVREILLHGRLKPAFSETSEKIDELCVRVAQYLTAYMDSCIDDKRLSWCENCNEPDFNSLPRDLLEKLIYSFSKRLLPDKQKIFLKMISAKWHPVEVRDIFINANVHAHLERVRHFLTIYQSEISQELADSSDFMIKRLCDPERFALEIIRDLENKYKDVFRYD